MFDDILDLFKRDPKRKRSGTGVRGLLDRLSDHDDERSPTHPRTYQRDHDDGWDDDDHRSRQDSRNRRHESMDWDD